MGRLAFGSALCLAAVCLRAQTPSPPSPAPAAADNGNPFPGNTTNVPVMPTATTPAPAEGTSGAAEAPEIPLPNVDQDPVRSPDESAQPEESAAPAGQGKWSSSLTGMDKFLPQQGDQDSGRKKRFFGREKQAAAPAPAPVETAPEDLRVGTYYLETHDWKGALSRFESAQVLDPDNPDVYWGLAEADRHLSDFAGAKANYEKVVAYDPGSHHAKDARKQLDEPEIANAQ